MDIELTLCLLALFSIVVVVYRQFFLMERFMMPLYVPVELVFETTVMVNTNERHTDIFIKDLISNKFEIYLIPRHPSKKYTMHKCISQECGEIDRIDYKFVDYQKEPLATSHEIERGKYIRVVEGFTSHHVSLTAKARTHIPLGKPTLLEDIAKTIQTEKIIVTVHETPETRKLFDLYACIWNDSSKSPTCEYIKWEPGTNPEIDMGRAYQMIRIIPKENVSTKEVLF